MTFYVLRHYSDEERHCGVFSDPFQAEEWRKKLVSNGDLKGEIINPNDYKGRYTSIPENFFTLLRVEVDTGTDPMSSDELPYATLTIEPTNES